MAYKNDKEVEEAIQKLRELSSDKLLVRIMQAEDRHKRDMLERMDRMLEEGLEKGIAQGLEKGIAQGLEKGIKEGRKKGRKEGAEEKSKEIAKKLKEIGMSYEEISEATGLSKEEIEKL